MLDADLADLLERAGARFPSAADFGNLARSLGKKNLLIQVRHVDEERKAQTASPGDQTLGSETPNQSPPASAQAPVRAAAGPSKSETLDEALQREIDEALGGKSMEDLLEETEKIPRLREPGAERVGPGQLRKGRVASVDARLGVLVDLGGKDTGLVLLEQFEEEPHVGDTIEVEIVRFDATEDLWVLSCEGALQRANWESLAEGSLVECFVEGTNKGGLSVKLGTIPAFMPVSQISMYRVEKPEEYVGQKLRCQVTELDRRSGRVIVSARALLELEAEKAREKLMAELKEGDVRDGIVRQVMPYGAFVDMGGVDGLVHVSQMSYARVEDPAELVKPGQKVQVRVLKIDTENNRISLGMKQTMPDPWEAVGNKYPAGASVTARVVKLEDFGAFAQIEPGVDGLLPISELSWTIRPKHPSDILQVGQMVQAVVLSVEPERHRISLSLKQAQSNPWTGAVDRYAINSEHTGKVTRLAEFGAFVELEPGIEGLVHISALSDQRVRAVGDVVKPGQEVRVKVQDVNEQARRISLSMKGLYAQTAAGPAGQAGAEAAAAPAAGPKKRKKPLKGGLDR